MTTTDRPPGAADDLPRRRHGRGTAEDASADLSAGPAGGGSSVPPPTSRRAARLAAARTEPAGPPEIVSGPLPTLGRSAYGSGTSPYHGAPGVGYPTEAAAQAPSHVPFQSPSQGGAVLDLDALARSAGRQSPPTAGIRSVGDLQVGPATTPIRRRRPVSLPEAFDVPEAADAEEPPEQATMPLRTQSRPPKTGTIRLRGRSGRPDAAPPAPPPMVSAPPTGTMPFSAAPPTGAMAFGDAPATGVIRRTGASTAPGVPVGLAPSAPAPQAAGTGAPRSLFAAPIAPPASAPVPHPPHLGEVRAGVSGPPFGDADGRADRDTHRPDRQPDRGSDQGPDQRIDPPAGATPAPSRRSRRRAAAPPDGAAPTPPASAPAPQSLPSGSAQPVAEPLPVGPVPTPDSADAGHGAPAPRRNRAGRNLPMAIAVGLGLATVVLSSLLIRKEAFVAVVCVAAVLAVWELAGALATKEITVPVVPLAVGSVGMLVSAFVAGEDGLLVSFALTSFGVLLWRIIDGAQDAARDVAASVFAAAYVPFLAGFTMLMLAAPDGARRIIVFILLVVASDTGGYTAGVLFGKHPMAPTVSPHKSWEGFAGSTLACVLAGSLGVIFLLHGVWYAGVAAGAAAVVTATVGDLSESLLKRDLGIKDMGHLLPGHGGMLDRIDSLLLTAPVVYVLLSLLVPLP